MPLTWYLSIVIYYFLIIKILAGETYPLATFAILMFLLSISQWRYPEVLEIISKYIYTTYADGKSRNVLLKESLQNLLVSIFFAILYASSFLSSNSKTLVLILALFLISIVIVLKVIGKSTNQRG